MITNGCSTIDWGISKIVAALYAQRCDLAEITLLDAVDCLLVGRAHFCFRKQMELGCERGYFIEWLIPRVSAEATLESAGIDHVVTLTETKR